MSILSVVMILSVNICSIKTETKQFASTKNINVTYYPGTSVLIQYHSMKYGNEKKW